jgi:hypothetical protein
VERGYLDLYASDTCAHINDSGRSALERHEFLVRAERFDKDDLERKIVEIDALSSNLLSNPDAGKAESLMYLAADVLFTLRMGATERRTISEK